MKKTTQTRFVMDAVVMPARQHQQPAPAERALDEPQLEDVDMPGPSNTLTSGLDSDDDEPKCAHGCQNGWLSRRTKFVLNANAADAVNSEGAMQGAPITVKFLPKKYQAKFKGVQAREGLYLILKAVCDIFKKGKVPHVSEVEETLDRMVAKDKQDYKAYLKTGASVVDALEALVFRARFNRKKNPDYWSDEMLAEIYDDEWESLPTCPIHDYDWKEVVDGLVA